MTGKGGLLRKGVGYPGASTDEKYNIFQELLDIIMLSNLFSGYHPRWVIYNSACYADRCHSVSQFIINQIPTPRNAI
jgi:hypothetical protein